MTGTSMTGPGTMGLPAMAELPLGEGERREAASRRKRLMVLGTLFVVGRTLIRRASHRIWVCASRVRRPPQEASEPVISLFKHYIMSGLLDKMCGCPY